VLCWALALGLVSAPVVAPPAVAADPAGRLLVVLSGSVSMRDTIGSITKVATARRGVMAFVDALPADGQVALRTYGTSKTVGAPDACQDTKRVVDFATNNRARLLAGLNDYHTSGDAPVATALTQGAADVKGAASSTIVLVSDGAVGCRPDPCATAASIITANPNLVVDVIGVAAEGDREAALKCIAEKGKGSYVRAETVLDVANAMETFATRTVRPADLAPVAISGGGDGAAAAEVVTGDYTDRLGPIGTDGAVRYFAVQRTIDSSDIGVAASILPTRTVDDGIRVEITSSGKSCASASAITTGATDSILSTFAAVGVGHTSYPECTSTKRLLIKVERSTTAKNVSKDDIPVTIRITEHEPVADQAALPQKLTVAAKGSSLSAGAPVAIRPGATIATGARLASGSTYAGTITPGELQTFRVNVQWGQNLGAKAIVLEPKPSVKAALDKRDKALTIRLLSPGGATSAYGYTSSLSSGGYTYVDIDPVVYRGQDSQMQAGEYTVAIGLTVDGDTTGITVPYQIVVQTVGAETGVPTYGVPGSVTATPTASSTSSGPGSTITLDPLPRTGPSPTTRLWLGLVGALLLGGGIGAWIQLGRIRSRRSRVRS
jgi:Ca-activated chloride channel family protein